MQATLLTLLERETAAVFFDECLMASCDLSQISWILTANDIHRISRPLLSRLRVVRAGRPAAAHFEPLLAGLLCGLAARHGARVEVLPALEPAAIERTEEHTPELQAL